MSDFLTIEKATNRDASNNILPEVETLEFWPGEEKPKIKYIPVPSGELKKIFTKKTDEEKAKQTVDEDTQIIMDYLIHPKMTEENIAKTSQAKVLALVIAILSGSTGKTQAAIKQNLERAAEKLTEVQLEVAEKKE